MRSWGDVVSNLIECAVMHLAVLLGL
jgi:hypothetical protein